MCATHNLLRNKNLVDTSKEIHSWLKNPRLLSQGEYGYVFDSEITGGK